MSRSEHPQTVPAAVTGYFFGPSGRMTPCFWFAWSFLVSDAWPWNWLAVQKSGSAGAEKQGQGRGLQEGSTGVDRSQGQAANWSATWSCARDSLQSSQHRLGAEGLNRLRTLIAFQCQRLPAGASDRLPGSDDSTIVPCRMHPAVRPAARLLCLGQASAETQVWTTLPRTVRSSMPPPLRQQA